jgi:hypothetical protein
LEAAKRLEAEAAERESAIGVREGFGELAECAIKLDAALAALVAESNAFTAVVRTRIHAFGSAYPSDQQVLVNATLALSTALKLTPWKAEFRHLAPGEKRTFVEVVQRWFEPAEARIKGRETTKQEAA